MTSKRHYIEDLNVYDRQGIKALFDWYKIGEQSGSDLICNEMKSRMAMHPCIVSSESSGSFMAVIRSKRNEEMA